jgi:hypothetical protein
MNSIRGVAVVGLVLGGCVHPAQLPSVLHAEELVLESKSGKVHVRIRAADSGAKLELDDGKGGKVTLDASTLLLQAAEGDSAKLSADDGEPGLELAKGGTERASLGVDSNGAVALAVNGPDGKRLVELGAAGPLSELNFLSPDGRRRLLVGLHDGAPQVSLLGADERPRLSALLDAQRADAPSLYLNAQGGGLGLRLFGGHPAHGSGLALFQAGAEQPSRLFAVGADGKPQSVP